MKARLKGVVDRIASEREGAQEIIVKTDDGTRKAINYTQFTGILQPGDPITLNTWAVELELGTGGMDFVVQSTRMPENMTPPGRIMKLRYTPWQFPVLTAGAEESPWHEQLCNFTSLASLPVVCAELHSQVPAIAASCKWQSQGAARIVYIMTDGAALPLPYSRLVAHMRDKGLIDAVITSGQAYGGDYEAVNIFSALAIAKVVANADVIVVCQGPGNTGTRTQFGFSGIEQGVALNAVASLEGTPIAVARLSFADTRPRHIGISYHTLTILSKVALCRTYVPLPRLPESQRKVLRAALDEEGLRQKHDFITVNAEAGLKALKETGIPVTTMGRGIEEEESFFLAACSGGLLAGQCLEETGMSKEQL
jgi:hypothetical protein